MAYVSSSALASVSGNTLVAAAILMKMLAVVHHMITLNHHLI